MKKYSFIKNLFVCFSIVVLASSCSEDTMDKINKNDNNPTNVQAKFLVAELEASTAFSVVGGDLSLYAAVYTELETGVHNQMYYADRRENEPTSTSTYNNTWENIYTNIQLAKLIISKCSEDGSEPSNIMSLAIAKILLAYNGAVVTDMFGDVPFSEAGVLDSKGLIVYLQPKVDKQEDIYKSINVNLDEAIILLGQSDAVASQVGTADYYYKGDKSMWLKAAYGLKARYEMRLLGKSADKNASLKKVLEYADKSFAISSQELKFDIYDGVAQNNPLASFSDARAALGSSLSYINKLKERNDPRLTTMFMNQDAETITDISKLNPAPNGTGEQSQGKYDIPVVNYSASAPTILLSYHEVQFLKAEAYARLGDNTNAETSLKLAIKAGFANLVRSAESTFNTYGYGSYISFTESQIDTYYAENIKALFTANPLKEVVNQKYLAFLGSSGESLEAYNDYRRFKGLGESNIILSNPLNSTKFPLRFTYGNSDSTSNPNIQPLVGDGTYVYTEPVWWAGGTR